MPTPSARRHSSPVRHLLDTTALREPLPTLYTYPSWAPRRNIDHILVSDSLTVEQASVLDYPLSDHLPISMRVVLPESVTLVP